MKSHVILLMTLKQTCKNTKGLHNLNSIYFSCTIFVWLLKGNHGQNEDIYTELKKIRQTWVGGLRVFPGLIIYFNCNHAITCFCMLQKHPTLLTIIDMHMCPPMDKP